MCGRFGLFAELNALADQFSFDPSTVRDTYHPRWNIPPTTPVLTIRHPSNDGLHSKNTAELMRWGIAAAQGKTQSKAVRPLFNARAETVHRLPSFKQAFRERRCLIPASGFYEWRKNQSSERTPVWFHRQDHSPIAFAGIWTSDSIPDGDSHSCAIITCAANDFVAPVHTRMPVILPPEEQRQWLNPRTDAAKLLDLLKPVDWPTMTQHTVSTDVNRADNDYPSLVKRTETVMQTYLTGTSHE